MWFAVLRSATEHGVKAARAVAAAGRSKHGSFSSAFAPSVMGAMRPPYRSFHAGAAVAAAGATMFACECARAEEVPIPEGRARWIPTPCLGRVAIVTGSSQGIGAGIALELAHAGADICVNYVGDVLPAREIVKQVEAAGRRAVLVSADVSKRDHVERMFDVAEKELGPVSILVTNAVTSTRANILETKPEDFMRTLNIGLVGVFHCMQVFSQRMLQSGRKDGSIVHIGSPHSKGPFKDAIDYNVTKAGSDHLARSAANELMWHRIRVNIVQPGWTFTEGELRLYSRETLDESAKQMPLGRLCMPADIGKAVVWLSSDEAAYVTGTCITVDGGQFIEGAPSWKSAGRHGA